MTLTPLAVSWAALAAVVVVLAIYRRILANKDDEIVHIDDAEAPLIAQQSVMAKRLNRLDRWGKILTLAALVYGLAVAGLYVYQAWREASTPGV